MEASAYTKYVRISPLKLRRISNTIKGEYVGDALNILNITPGKAADIIKMTLKSAISNAFQKKMKEEDLYISSITIEKGPYLKRIKARSRGRATLILKPTSHIKLKISERT